MEGHISKLKEKIDELNGAIDVCEQIEKESLNIDELDSTYYLNLIEGKEQNGLRFTDILNEWINFEKDQFYHMWKYIFFVDIKKFNFSSIRNFIILLLIICMLRGLTYHFIWKMGSFIEGFLYPFIVFTVVSLILLPLYLLKYKHPMLAKWLSSILAVIFSLILTGIILVIIVLFLNLWLHFWF